MPAPGLGGEHGELGATPFPVSWALADGGGGDAPSRQGDKAACPRALSFHGHSRAFFLPEWTRLPFLLPPLSLSGLYIRKPKQLLDC